MARTAEADEIDGLWHGEAAPNLEVVSELRRMARTAEADEIDGLYARIPHLAQTSDAVNRQLSCFSSRYMNLLAVFQI